MIIFLLCFSVCQDLQDEILCSEAKKAGNCEQMPWNGKCRKTCGRCGTFINTLQGLKEEWGGVGWVVGGGPDPVFALPSMTIPRPELLKCLSRIPFSFPITYPVPIFAGESRFPRKRSNTVFHQKQFWVFPNPAKYLGLKSSPDPANTLSESVHCLS